MTPSTLSAPTTREIVLVVLLFISLFYFSSSPRNEYRPLDTYPSEPPPNPHLNEPADLAQPAPPAMYRHGGYKDIESRITWGKSDAKVPDSKIISHSPGWTILTNLYVYKGTFYIVSDTPSAIPDVSAILSQGINILPGDETAPDRLPTEKDIQVISKAEARQLFGTGAQVVDGLSFVVNDSPQYITHYYHWAAELWFGLWRAYSSLAPSSHNSSTGTTSLPPPDRLIFTHLDAFHWRDYASMNQLVLRASFPSLTMEFVDDWRDRAELPSAFVFSQVLLADRSAAMLSYNFRRFQRTAAVPFSLPGPAVLDWWMPIRNNVVQFAGIDLEKEQEEGGIVPVITYVSRQDWTRRKLLQDHHENLVRELYKLRDEYGYEVNVVSMDKLSRQEQIRLASRTTIMMGVHGNGLTSLLWMNPTPRSTVIEFFFPGGFAHDYEFTARAMGMSHYGFWNSQHFTSPNFPLPAYPEGFQGNEIPIDGAAVARLCHDRLSMTFEVDD
ncbi:hypothetical protein VKT23_016392 [Stygiomarasmius scandens]|uniref:Glycosyltransferase 61 catalytic domain-containing protein n=1 Tax=Marasmiellus scandens TaxID=2682957 RepID=A0ABR1IUX5_9AGAR